MRWLLPFLVLLIVPFVYSFNVQINTNTVQVINGEIYIYLQPSQVLYLDKVFIIDRTGELSLDPRPPINYVFIVDTSFRSQVLKYLKNNINNIVQKLNSITSIPKYALITVDSNARIRLNFTDPSTFISTITTLGESNWNKHYIVLEKALLVYKLKNETRSGHYVVLIFTDKGPIAWSTFTNYISTVPTPVIVYSKDTNIDSTGSVSSYLLYTKYALVYKYTTDWIDDLLRYLNVTTYKKAYVMESSYTLPYGSEIKTRYNAFSFKHSNVIGYVGILYKAPSQVGEYIDNVCIVQVDTNQKKCFKIHYIVGKLVEIKKLEVYPKELSDNIDTYLMLVLYNALPTSETTLVKYKVLMNNKVICSGSKTINIPPKSTVTTTFTCHIPKNPYSFVVEYNVWLDNGIEKKIRKVVLRKEKDIVTAYYFLYTPFHINNYISMIAKWYGIHPKDAYSYVKECNQYLRSPIGNLPSTTNKDIAMFLSTIL